MNSEPRSPASSPPLSSPVPTLSPLSPAGTSTVPVPPKGPGVVVPFPAPPRDPDKSRLALSIIAGVTALVLVCGGVLASAIGVLVWADRELAAQSVEVAGDFLDDIVTEDYKGAYRSLCEDTRDRLPRKDFTKDWSELGIVAADPVSIGTDQQDMVVFAEMELSDGAIQDIELTVVLEQQSMRMAVCDWQIVQ